MIGCLQRRAGLFAACWQVSRGLATPRSSYPTQYSSGTYADTLRLIHAAQHKVWCVCCCCCSVHFSITTSVA